MSDVMIRGSNLGKKYMISHQVEGRSNYVALRDVLADGAKSLVKQFTGGGNQRATQEEFWALKDVSFEVKRGNVWALLATMGRENIDLNGAILGMTRAEIKKKSDEIVDFVEVEKFLDTPVKRYSSGMYVRLAFAVATRKYGLRNTNDLL